jgi:hypothetical protein
MTRTKRRGGAPIGYLRRADRRRKPSSTVVPAFVPRWDEIQLKVPAGSRAAFAEMLMGFARDAYAAQGMRAFEAPRSAALVHEAGHAVQHAAEGDEVTSLKIFRRSYADGMGAAWGGVTFGGESWCADLSSDPRADLKQARILIAGVEAERLFEGKQQFRHGSSLDEVTAFHALIGGAARKLGCDFMALARQEAARVEATLRRHASVVRAIAARLDRHGAIKGERLARLLAPVNDAVLARDHGVTA